MKLDKNLRDEYVLNNYQKLTNKQLAEDTGWSETTIKAVKRRLGLVKSKANIELREFIINNKEMEPREVAEQLGIKIDTVIDTLKYLGLYIHPTLKRIKKELEDKYIIEESNITNNRDKITYTCKKCGDTKSRAARFILQDITGGKGVICQCESELEDFIKEEIVRKRKYIIKQYNMRLKNPQFLGLLDGGKCLVKCLNCGDIREIKYDSFKSRKSLYCSTCQYKDLNKEEYYINEIIAGGYTIASQYINSNAAIKVICKNGHIRETTPYNIVKYGCKYCEREYPESSFIYLMHVACGFTKIGVSTAVERRARELELESELGTHTIITAFQMKTQEAYKLEKILHTKYKKYNEKLEDKFGGYTEYFKLSDTDIQEIVSIISKNTP